MFPGEDEIEEVENEPLSDEELGEDDPLDFDDEEPAGEGAFADDAESEYAQKTAEKVKLTNGVERAADVKNLLDQVRQSKKKARSR
jgi:hypothetical protein